MHWDDHPCLWANQASRRLYLGWPGYIRSHVTSFPIPGSKSHIGLLSRTGVPGKILHSTFILEEFLVPSLIQGTWGKVWKQMLRSSLVVGGGQERTGRRKIEGRAKLSCDTGLTIPLLRNGSLVLSHFGLECPGLHQSHLGKVAFCRQGNLWSSWQISH